jgi:hypothetical protein
MDNLRLILETLDATLSHELASYLSKHLVPCAEQGCGHMATDLEDYSCWYCHKRFCLALHLVRVNIVDLYSKAFQQALFYPPCDYMCEMCIEYVASEFQLYEEDSMLFIHRKWEQMTRKMLGREHPWQDYP